MPYPLIEVYDTTGTELSNALHTCTLAGTNHIAYDGRYVWVTCGTNGIALIDHWYDDADRTLTNAAFTDLDEVNYPSMKEHDLNILAVPQNKLKVVTYITVTATQILRSTTLYGQRELGSTEFPRAGTDTTVEGIYTVKVNNYNDIVYAKQSARIGTGVALNAMYIKKLGDKMYVTNGSNFTQIYEFDISTQNFVRVITVGDTYTGPTTIPLTPTEPVYTNGTTYSMLSNLEATGDKLWFVGRSFGESTPQKLYWLNPSTGETGFSNIQSRPGFARSYVADAQNGFVYVTNYNGFNVSKFNAETGAFVSNIRVNGFPQGVWSGPDRRIWVTSFAGMLSLIDWDDDSVHSDYSSESVATVVQSDPVNSNAVWFINSGVPAKLARYDLNELTQFETNTAPTEEDPIQDFTFTSDKLATPENFLILPGFTYLNDSLATVAVKPHIFVLTDNKIVSWFIGHPNSPDENDPQADLVYFDYTYPFEDYPYRTVYAELNGQAAVVAGPNTYFGE